MRAFMCVPGFRCVMRAFLLSNMDGWKMTCPFSQTLDVQKAVLSMIEGPLLQHVSGGESVVGAVWSFMRGNSVVMVGKTNI